MHDSVAEHWGHSTLRCFALLCLETVKTRRLSTLLSPPSRPAVRTLLDSAHEEAARKWGPAGSAWQVSEAQRASLIMLARDVISFLPSPSPSPSFPFRPLLACLHGLVYQI